MGYIFDSRFSLTSLAPTLFWVDFRRAARNGGTGLKWRFYDKSGNGIDLWHNSTSTNFNNVTLGWGVDGTWGCNFTGTNTPLLAKLFDGTPCALYVVHSMPEVSGFGHYFHVCFLTNTTTQTSSPLRAYGMDMAERALELKFGSGTSNYTTGTLNAIPVNQYVLNRFLNYGSAASNPTIKMIGHLTSNNVNYGSWASAINALFYMRQNNNNVHYTKMMIAYDLSGKTKAQIDAFDVEFYNALRQDPEYALV